MQTAQAGSAVSAADKDFFERNGYLVVRGLLSAEEVAALRRRADDMASPESNHTQRNREVRKATEQRWAEARAAEAGAGG
ncbi:MAG: phytanoyl-CoA dioxygenase family protein, partial [Chloroflexota bacterium]